MKTVSAACFPLGGRGAQGFSSHPHVPFSETEKKNMKNNKMKTRKNKKNDKKNKRGI